MTDIKSAGRVASEDGEPSARRRLRRWRIAQKCRIVEETFVPGASVSVVARRHDVNANLLFEWRKLYREGRLVDRKAQVDAPIPDLLRIGVVDHDGGIRPLSGRHPIPAPGENGKAMASPESRPPCLIEIELSGGTKVRVDAGIDEAALRRVLAVIKDAAA